MRQIFSETLRRRSQTASDANRRVREDEPPIEHPQRLSYLLKLLQEELRAGSELLRHDPEAAIGQ
jgi:hypothetical protein